MIFITASPPALNKTPRRMKAYYALRRAEYALGVRDADAMADAALLKPYAAISQSLLSTRVIAIAAFKERP